jgi:apoptosis-inducing factor 2
MRVVVVGGGYGGVAVAKAVDDVADVTLVEPKEMFVHHVAQHRAAVDPAWAERIFFPYGKLLSRGVVIREAAAEVRPGVVTLASGLPLAADVIVLATGSAGPFPTRLDADDRETASRQLAGLHTALESSAGVLLLGAGAIGLEFAGEIAAAWPGKPVTVVDPAEELLGGRFTAELRTEIAHQLDQLGVRVLLGTKLGLPPRTAAGVVSPFEVTTSDGETIAADLWFRCYGGTVPTGYLGPELAKARTGSGRLAVDEHLRVRDGVFALGDLVDTPELKMGRVAARHAEVVAANIRALIEGGPMTAHEPLADGIMLSLGPSGGAGYAPGLGFFGAEATVGFKGTFLLEEYRALLEAPGSVRLPGA